MIRTLTALLGTAGVFGAAAVQAHPGRLCFPAIAATVLAQAAEADEDGLASKITLDFPGGTAAEYERLVRERAGNTVNIVSFTDLSRFHMPPVQLKGVSGHEALGMIQHTTRRDESGQVWGLQMEWGEAIVIKPVFQGRSDASMAYSRIWSIEALTTQIPAEDILSAVEVALAMIDSSAQVRYHEDSGLLIARGTDEQLSAIDDVLDALKDTYHARRDAAARQSDASQKQASLETARAEVALREQELQAAQSRLARLQQLVDAGQASMDDLEVARLAVSTAEFNVLEALSRMKSYETP